MTFPGLLTRSLSMYTEEGIAEAIGAMKVVHKGVLYLPKIQGTKAFCLHQTMSYLEV